MNHIFALIAALQLLVTRAGSNDVYYVSLPGFVGTDHIHPPTLYLFDAATIDISSSTHWEVATGHDDGQVPDDKGHLCQTQRQLLGGYPVRVVQCIFP